MRQDDYVARWKAFGYRSKMGSETITLPPPKTFRRVYHMMESRWAVVAIADQRLKVSRFENLNDPFELFALNGHTPAARKASNRFAADFGATTGLVSFAMDWSNVVMWSHYAERHAGISLGFDVRRSLLVEIGYEDERIRAALGNDPATAVLSQALQRQLKCTKAKAWKYEEEFRRFIPLGAAEYDPPHHYINFDSDMQLAEVILGERCTQNLDHVRRLLARKSPGAVAFKGRLSLRSFRVVLDGHTRPSGSPQH